MKKKQSKQQNNWIRSKHQRIEKKTQICRLRRRSERDNRKAFKAQTTKQLIFTTFARCFIHHRCHLFFSIFFCYCCSFVVVYLLFLFGVWCSCSFTWIFFVVIFIISLFVSFFLFVRWIREEKYHTKQNTRKKC